MNTKIVLADSIILPPGVLETISRGASQTESVANRLMGYLEGRNENTTVNWKLEIVEARLIKVDQNGL